MKIFFTITALVFCLSLRAQTPLVLSGARFDPWASLYRPLTLGSALNGNPSWQLYPYTGISAAYGFFNGSSVSALYAPAGLQLFHPISNRVAAFAAVSVAPTLFSYSRNFYPTGMQNGYNTGNSYQFGVIPRMELGLMYTNEEHTFSISGSIGVERGSNYLPYLPAERRQTGSKR